MLVCAQELDGKELCTQESLILLAEGLGLVVVDFTEEIRRLGSSQLRKKGGKDG